MFVECVEFVAEFVADSASFGSLFMAHLTWFLRVIVRYLVEYLCRCVERNPKETRIIDKRRRAEVGSFLR